MSISQKLTSAALAGLFAASIVTAGAAFAADEKAPAKEKAAAEKQCCKTADGKAKDPKECKHEKASCKGKDGKKPEGEAK